MFSSAVYKKSSVASKNDGLMSRKMYGACIVSDELTTESLSDCCDAGKGFGGSFVFWEDGACPLRDIGLPIVEETDILLLLRTSPFISSSVSLSLAASRGDKLYREVPPRERILAMEKLEGGAGPRTVRFFVVLRVEDLRDKVDGLGDIDLTTGRETVLELANAPRFEAGVRSCRYLA